MRRSTSRTFWFLITGYLLCLCLSFIIPLFLLWFLVCLLRLLLLYFRFILWFLPWFSISCKITLKMWPLINLLFKTPNFDVGKCPRGFSKPFFHLWIMLGLFEILLVLVISHGARGDKSNEIILSWNKWCVPLSCSVKLCELGLCSKNSLVALIINMNTNTLI